MLILLNTGLKEGLNLPNLGINFRLPTEPEKDKFYSVFESKKADSFFGSYEGIKDKFLVIDFGKEDEIHKLYEIEDFQIRNTIISNYQDEKKKIIYKLYFLFASADIIENANFFSYESKIRIIDTFNFDSSSYNKTISEIYTEESLYKDKLGMNIYNIEASRKFLANFDLIYLELKHLYNDDYFQYVGELLYHYIQTDSKIMKFSVLSSIIEFFLTNGKNKVTEQFIFKTMIIKDRIHLSYLNYEGYNIATRSSDYEIDKKDLETIYGYRSQIVHGNFNSCKASTKEFQIIFSKLKFFTACVLHQYILSPDFMKAIKNNG